MNAGALWAARLFAFLWMGLIFYVSSQPSLPTPSLFPGQDKVAHGLIYAVLGVAYWISVYGLRQRASIPGVLWITLLAMLYGLSDEFHQSFVPGRSTEALDLLADTVGGFIGAFLACRQIPRLLR